MILAHKTFKYLEICHPFLKFFNFGGARLDWNNNKVWSANNCKYQDYFFFYRLPTNFINCTLAMIILGCLTCQEVQFLLQENNNVFA